MIKKVNRYFVYMFVAFLILVLLTTIRNINSKFQVKISKLKDEIEDLRRENLNLRSELEKLKSSEKLEKIAREKGFVPLTKEKIFYLKLN